MEDVIIYSVGALVVRGLRRAVFGPPREERLAEEVGTGTRLFWPSSAHRSA